MNLFQLHALLDTIKEVHSQHADDLCWMPADVNKIFEAAGLPPQNLQVGDKVAMRANCDRYIACLQSGGLWKSYAELEQQLKDYQKYFPLLYDWAKIWNKQAGGYLASDTSLIMLRCEALATGKSYKELCRRELNSTLDKGPNA